MVKNYKAPVFKLGSHIEVFTEIWFKTDSKL